MYNTLANFGPKIPNRFVRLEKVLENLRGIDSHCRYKLAGSIILIQAARFVET